MYLSLNLYIYQSIDTDTGTSSPNEKQLGYRIYNKKSLYYELEAFESGNILTGVDKRCVR